MFHRREANWIGFQEAQQAICSLKAEVEIAEKKIRNAKRSFIKQTAKRKTSSDNLPSEKFMKPHLSESKAKIVPYKVSLLTDETATVPKKIFSASEEEPDIPPFKFLHSEPLDLKNPLTSSFDYLFSTTEDSTSVTDVKYSSSEKTSSLIASTYREADKFLNKCDGKEKVATTHLSKSFTTETSKQDKDHNEKEMLCTKISPHTNAGDIGMEWSDVSKNKAFYLQNKFKTEKIYKLKDIINRQKKREELHQLQIEQDVFSSFEPRYHDNIQQPELIANDNEVLSVPVRKIRTVKSLPNYKGFSVPPKQLQTSKKWKKQRNKHTIVNSSSFKNCSIKPLKRIKATVNSENNVASSLRGKDLNKSTAVEKKDENCSQGLVNKDSETSKDSIQDKISTDKQNDEDKPFQENTNLKNDIQSILNANQLSDDNSLNDVKDTTFSYDIPMQPASSVGNINQNSLKETKKLSKSKISSKKAKALQEPNISSPKVKQYDVEKVREYIKKKKEERRRRHLEEHRKKLLEAQKKKECLEKLIEYQKQNVKAVAKVKPLSPVKTFPKDNIVTKEQENIQGNTILSDVQNSREQDINDIIEKEKTISNDDDLERKLREDAPKKDNSLRNQVSISNSQKRKHDNMHIDISIPKVISASATQTISKNVKDSLISCDKADTEPRKNATKSERFSEPLIESSMQEEVIKTVEQEGIHDMSIDIAESQLFNNMSNISTPSGISEMTGVDSRLIEEIKVCVDPLPKRKQRKNKELKELVKAINEMTAPLESLSYTKQWLSKNPPPPKIKRTKMSETIHLPEQEHHSGKNRDNQLDNSQATNSKESSFKEQVSGIGDVSQLYVQILGKKPTHETTPDFEGLSIADESSNHNKTHQYSSNEEEIIEGSLKSELEYTLNQSRAKNLEACSEASNFSSNFSDLQKENIIPDPFNFINTWKKKPLGFTVQDRKVQSKGIPSKLSSSNVPFEEMYKSMLNTSSGETNPSNSFTHESSRDLLHNQEGETSSFISDKESSISRIDPTAEIPSNKSDNSKISLSMSSVTSKRLSEKSTISSKCKKTSQIIETSRKDSNKISKRRTVEVDEDFPNVNLSNASDMILSGTIYSEYTLESEKSSPAAVSNEHSNNTSDVILSGTINSEYTSDTNGGESGKEEVEEAFKTQSNEKASASESSISEVISVVENSKGFKSSAEDLLSDRNSVSPNDVVPSADDKSNSFEKDATRQASENNAQLQSDYSSAQNQKSSFDQSSKAVHLTGLSQKNDPIQSISSGSPNSVTIDFRKPLRFTLSNGESVQTNQELNMHENQYLHTQVVTRVASEAAAAAATSAVIAVFETQKALLAQKKHFGIINAYETSSKSQKIHYSSDFESSADAKSSSPSPHSSAADSKHTDLVAEDPPASNKDELSARSESVEEQIFSNHSISDQMIQSKSSNSSSIKSEGNQPSLYSESAQNTGQKVQERSRRKSSNVSSPSPASLSENGSATTETSLSSNSHLSHLSESALSDDSFAQLTLDVVRKMTQEEELRASHQLAFLKFQEKVLVQKARAEMAWLESLKKKLKQKGAEKKASAIKKRQKELILRLRQERAQLQCMQEAYRSICEKNSFLLKDKKKLLKEPSLLGLELLNKEEKPGTSKYREQKMKELDALKSSSSTASLVSENEENTMISEDSASEVPEMLKNLTSNSSQESVIEAQPSEFTKICGSSQNKSQRSSPNSSFSPINVVPSNSNPSIHSSNSLESVLQGLKKLEASKRHLTKREQRILQRRKKVEHLLQWQKKLDNEEIAVRELEKKALDIVDHSKKKTKYYVSSSGSTNQEDNKRRELIKPESLILPASSELTQHFETPVQYTSETENKTIKTSDDSIHTNFSVNELEGSDGDKGKIKISSAAHSSDSLPEEIKPGSGESSIQIIETTENGSQAEEIASEEISNQISPSIKNKSSSSDVYSEPFESPGSKKSSSILSISPPFKNASPSKSFKKDYGPGIRLPLVPRNLRRHDSSGSDDSYTISQSETASDQSDIEVRIHALSEELKRRKAEAEKLKREQKKKNRERLKEKELSLQKQLEAYNQYIHQAKFELDQQIESAVSSCQTSDVVVKPRIKWPRPEKVDSSRVRKQASLNSETFGLEKKTEIINSGPEASENYETPATRENDKVIKKLSLGPSAKNEEENTNKEVSEKSSDDSKDISEALSVSNSSKVQEISEIMPTNSVSSEVATEMNENISLSSTKSQESTDANSSNSDQKPATEVSSQCENRSLEDKSDSKSQTDTFISESTSSKNSALNSLEPIDENTVSNKTVSSNDESNIFKGKKISKDLSETSSTQQPPNTSYEANSSEDSVSEIPSVNDSASLEEELDCGSLSKSSKCNSSEGCEAPFMKEIIDRNNENKILQIDISERNDSQSKKEIKKILSESEVVNIVNYLSVFLINDAFHNLFEISDKRSNLKNFLPLNSSGKKFQVKLSVKENAAEALVSSLLNLHLEDAFASLFKIFENRRTLSQKSGFLLSNSSEIRDDMPVTDPLSSESTSNNNKTMVIEENSECPVNPLSHDVNSNQILANANPNDSYFTPSEIDQQFQQQQLVLHQYSYFYRKIPNKPPPPYTPPSSPVISSEFPFVKEKPVEKITTVKKVTQHIHEVLDNVLEIILDGKSKGLPLCDISLSKADFNFDKLDLSTPSQSVFVDFVFDLTKEIILEKFREAEQIPQPWLRPRKLTPKPLIPSSKEVIRKSIMKDLEKALKINEEPKNFDKRKQMSWSSLKLGRKKRDFVDTILIRELKEEEPDWVNYDQDEVTVKLQIADSIFNVLVNDTICTIKNIQQKLQL